MQKRSIILLSVMAALLLAGCGGIEKMCGYTMNYNCPNYGNPICGPSIKYKCDRYCDVCNASEKECKACWACIKND